MDEAVAGHATFIEVTSTPTASSPCRQRPRHPGRPASEIPEEVGARSHHDDAARRRQIRFRRLPDLRRPARRRRLGRQCAVRRLEVEVARGQMLYRQVFDAASPSASSNSSAGSPTGAARKCASIRTRRFSARARSSARRGCSAWRGRKPICSAASKSAGIARRACRWRRDTPAEAVFRFPGGLKDYLARGHRGQGNRRRPSLYRQSRKARRPWFARMGGLLAHRRRRLHQFLLQHDPDA